MTTKKRQKRVGQERRQVREKRLSPRLKTKVTVQYRVKETPVPEKDYLSIDLSADITHSKDLSERGILFTTSCVISPQTILDITLRLPVLKISIDLEGRVLGCEEIAKDLIYGVRVEFINLKDRQKEALRKFIQLFLKG